MNQRRWILPLLVLLLLSGGALAGEGAEGEPESEQLVKHIKIVAENWKWSPKVIRVKAGTKLILDFDSLDSSHSFEIKKLKIKVPLPEGSSEHVEFVVDTPGTYAWRCGRPCGNGCAKMRGKLIVEE